MITTGVGATTEGEKLDSTPKTQGEVGIYSKEADGGGGSLDSEPLRGNIRVKGWFWPN